MDGERKRDKGKKESRASSPSGEGVRRYRGWTRYEIPHVETSTWRCCVDAYFARCNEGRARERKKIKKWKKEKRYDRKNRTIGGVIKSL